MSSQTSSPSAGIGRSLGGGDDDDDLSKNEIFDLLRNQRRRYALQYLKRCDRPAELGDIATQVAAWEYDTTTEGVTSDQRKRVYTTLQQTHLPKLDEVGIIEYDGDRGIVEDATRAQELSVYMEIVPGNEFPWREYYLSLGAISCALVAVAWGGLYPFSMVADIVWAGIIAVSLTVSALVHVYHERHMRLDASEVPPELGFED